MPTAFVISERVPSFRFDFLDSKRMQKLHFVLSDLVAKEAAAAFADHERRIHERLPNVEIGHIGGTSVLGVLTTQAGTMFATGLGIARV